MDNQNTSGFDDYVDSGEQYAHGDAGFDMFQMVNGVPVSASLSFQFQNNSGLQDMSAMPASQLFRNNDTVAHTSQAPQPHQDFGAFQQMQGSMVRPHQLSDPSTRGISARLPPNTASPPRRAEEPDSACRPRLTPEQTQFLEEIFAHTPRPTTQQKKRHAIELGLTHEKVNNWFQNRRAKSKQMTRIRRELSIMTPDIHMHQWNGNSPSFLGESLSSPPQCAQPDDQTVLPMGSLSQIQSAAVNMETDVWSQTPSNSTSASSYTSSEDINAIIAQNIGMNAGMMNGDLHHQSAQETEFSPLSQIPSDWIFNTGMAASSHEQSMNHNEAHMQQVLMSLHQNQSILSQAWQNDGAAANMNGISVPESTASVKQEAVSSPARLRSQCNSASVSQQVTPQRSPSPRSQASMAVPFISKSFVRRDSTTSELANNINTFHLQKIATHNSSDDEVFKTPKIPNLNLAARRKKERPAALVSMRTASTPNAADVSPSSGATAIPATAVRRIKSAGNSLNVFNRVQKSGASSAQRSPLAQTFRDASALEKLHSSVGRLSDTFSSDMTSIKAESQISNPSPEANATQPWATSPSDSLGAAPPLSASFTQNSYEDNSWVASPPVTPLYKSNVYAQPFAGIEVPQSAPAHMTQFPNLSPPPINQPITPSHYYPAQYHNDTSFYAPIPMPPPLHSQSHILKAYEMDQQPRIMRPGSVGAHYGLFSAMGPAPPKEQKELEVVMASFPTPEARPRSLPRNNGNCVFTFQNTGPKDYACSG